MYYLYILWQLLHTTKDIVEHCSRLFHESYADILCGNKSSLNHLPVLSVNILLMHTTTAFSTELYFFYNFLSHTLLQHLLCRSFTNIFLFILFYSFRPIVNFICSVKRELSVSPFMLSCSFRTHPSSYTGPLLMWDLMAELMRKLMWGGGGGGGS